LLLVAENKHKTTITLLLEVAASDVEAKNARGKTPLQWAAENGYKRIAKLLLDAGGSVATKDKEGRTALHWGTRNGHTGTATMLLDAGA
ncbi:ankyrin repeat protein, partial [Baffinella frigidus]